MGYSTVNNSNLANNTQLDQGLLLYAANGFYYGMDLGFSTGAFSTRLFGPMDGQIVFSTYGQSQTPSAQQDFTNVFSVNLRSGQASFDGVSTGLLMSGTSQNTDFTGELSLKTATTATYVFAGTYANHPECVLSLQFNAGSNQPWLTYSGSASFTINFAQPVTGQVGYTCSARD